MLFREFFTAFKQVLYPFVFHLLCESVSCISLLIIVYIYAQMNALTSF